MKLSLLFSLFIGISPTLLFSQEFNPFQPPNTYQSDQNPIYWKNKIPVPGYWQQDVYYKIKANIDEKSNVIEGTQMLIYTNNSPDTLKVVYFNLYQNAFQPNSYYDRVQRAQKIKTKYGIYETMGLGTEILKLTVNGQEATAELDNTILRVHLPQPLPPNSSTQFDIDFKTYFDDGGNVRRRMKMFTSWGYKHYDGVAWYPRIAVYDRKFGWNLNQHMEKEFYGDFGTYDVELTFANNFIVEATGLLQNRSEVLPDTLRQRLDILNFREKPWNSDPSVIIPYSDEPSTRKTWHFYAENVHDFAFTADPTYRIGEVFYEGVVAVAVVQEPHVIGWLSAAPYSSRLIRIYSDLLGQYVYPKIVVADARDGMEYPMLTLDGGFDPFYRDLLAHEIAHQWFHGMVGTNEVYRAFMDEGFAQFLDSEGMIRMEGPFMPTGYYNKYDAKFSKPVRVVDEEIYLHYLNAAINGNDAVLNTHSEEFEGILRNYSAYRLVYTKGGAMLYNLKYVLGDQLFWQALSHYFNQWKIAHPYPEDFINSVIDFTGVDLNWFFDQWLNTEKKIDYGIKNVDKLDGGYRIKFERIGEMQMPIDFTVITTDSVYHFHIPNTEFVKNTSATVLPKWTGWDKLNPEYIARIQVSGRVRDILIDPSHQLADVNMLNNSKKIPYNLRFDVGKAYYPEWRAYQPKWRPDLWYNNYDGVKAGLHLEGNYMNHRHIFSLTGWYNTGFLQDIWNVVPPSQLEGHDRFSFIGSYKTAINKISRKTFFHFEGRSLDGINGFKTGIESQIKNDYSLNVFFKSFIMSTPFDLNYVLYEDQWQPELWNNSININVKHPYNYLRGNGRISLNLRSASLFSDFNYNYIDLEVINNNFLGKIDLRTRTFARAGSGDFQANASALFFAGASPEELLDNKYTRAKAFFPPDWAMIGDATNHFHAGGGLNMRGYSGYAVVEGGEDGLTHFAYRGQSGASVNAELEFDKLIKFSPRFLSPFHLDTYVFADAGLITFHNIFGEAEWSDVRMDAGVGAALTIKRFWHLETPKPLVLRIDFPFYLSHAPFVEEKNIKFRWIVGINRAF